MILLAVSNVLAEADIVSDNLYIGRVVILEL